MKDNLRTISAQQRAKSVAPEDQRPVGTPATSIERRSPGRQKSRGDKRRMSPSVVVHIVQAYDFVLLLFSGLLAEGMLTPIHWLRFDGSFFLATFVGSLVTAAFFSRAEFYLLRSLCRLSKQLQVMALPLLVGCGSMIVSLSLMRDDRLVS
jgi:hypothetical protein